MKRVKSLVAKEIGTLISKSESEVMELLSPPRNREFGDLSLPCFSLVDPSSTSPATFAQELAPKLAGLEAISAASAAGPFVNLKLRGNLVSKAVIDYLRDSPLSSVKTPERVVVEYSSPNIAKPFHVGHLRATLIGNSLDRLYRALGHKTISINHLGDWGTQFGLVWAGCELWGKPDKPSVATLVEIYRKATGLKEAQEKNQVTPEEAHFPKVNDLAKKFFLDLENNEQYALDFWQLCLDVSLSYLKKTYERLDISFNYYLGESFYRDKFDPIKSDLEKKNLLVESQGALGVELGEELGFARVQTPDGRSLYLTRDLAAAEYRSKEFKFDRALYVVGAPQALHFQQLKEILKRIDRNYADSLEHVAFGHVMGMKTRGRGGFIELNDFLDEAEDRALTAYREQVSKRPEGLDEQAVAKAVARAAVIFSTLSRSRLKDVQFNWDQALTFQGDSGPYILYAYARIGGIEQKARDAGVEPIDPAQIDCTKIIEPEAVSLLMQLDEFDSAAEKALATNEPSILAAYSLDLAKSFSRAYLELRVLDEAIEVAQARLCLFTLTKQTLGRALELLGIPVIERM